MTDMTKPRIRGAVRVRAETGDANAIVTELNKAFAAFKTEHQEELKGINAKFADVVQAEKVERINAEIGNLQTALDETNAQLAAARLGGAGESQVPSAEMRDHARAFNQFFRRGTEEGLRELEMKAAL